MHKKQWFFFCLLLFLYGPTLLHAESPRIVAAVMEAPYPPFIVPQADQKATGIMFDVFFQIMQKLGYSVEVQQMPRKRLDVMFAQGKIDTMALAKEWVKAEDQKKYRFSDPVVRVSDMLFYRAEKPLLFEKPQDLFGKTIGFPAGYHYPSIEAYFKTEQIKTVETPTENEVLEMLLKDRLDGGLTAQIVGLWLIKENGWQGQLAFAPKEVDGFDFRFAFLAKWEPLIPRINAELARMKTAKEIEAIEAKYR